MLDEAVLDEAAYAGRGRPGYNKLVILVFLFSSVCFYDEGSFVTVFQPHLALISFSASIVFQLHQLLAVNSSFPLCFCHS